MRTVVRSFLVLTFAAPLAAQNTRTLSRPDVEFPEPFTNATGVRELRDGRVIVSDPRDKVVQLIDFRTSRATKVGREGNGPREYALPMALLALPGDTSAIYDPLNQRFLLINPDGSAGEFFTVAPDAGAAGAGLGRAVFGITPRYSDSRGRLYMTGLATSVTPDGVRQADSVPVIRYDRSTKSRDTVGYFRQPRDNASGSVSGNRQQIRIGGGNPFSARDEWAVTADGRVAVVRSPEYRVDFVGPARSSGPAIPYPKVRVSERHKEQWRQSRQNATVMMVRNDNGRQTTSTGSAANVSIPEPTDWPEVMPPFLSSAVLVAPDGNLWVARTREADDDTPRYDVIDGSGRVIERVALPRRTRVIGFGRGVVYTVRSDEDDLQYLQRFALSR
ncbi:MAG: hypothetical protein ACT4OZ_13365 [Gemmatimonadota bacterium]